RQELIDTYFLNYLLTTKLYKDQLFGIGEQGATRQAITKAQIENFTIIFPKSIAEQKSIVIKLDALFAETKKLEAIYQQKLANLEELKKSVLKKAFAGELVE
ncbi:MAG: restriction endonuclease subunit S, partial [Candidatus Magasanikbacteria bacterium CG_4_9_14_0_2_um_filter_41_10]